MSIIIPMYNASKSIQPCLDRVFMSTFSGYEVILVDDSSTDDTLEKCRPYRCRVFKTETNKGPAAARNLGIEHAKGSVLVFIDSDVLVPDDLLDKVWNCFIQRPGISVVQARYGDTPFYKNLYSQYKHFVFSFRGSNPRQGYIDYVHTACVAIRKSVFSTLRFNEALRRREDVEFGLRCREKGFLIFGDASIRVAHAKKYDLASFSRYQFRAAREMMLQHTITKNKNLTQEFSSPKQPLYKKVWFLRPILSGLLIANMVWLCFRTNPLPSLFLILILAGSFIVEYQFRLYLLRVAPLKVSLGAWFLYFYDGLMVGLGATVGLLRALGARFRKPRPALNESLAANDLPSTINKHA